MPHFLPLIQANEFQVQARKLPKALRDWAAYKDCRRTIDDFLALLPLFQALSLKSIRERWACWAGARRLAGCSDRGIAELLQTNLCLVLLLGPLLQVVVSCPQAQYVPWCPSPRRHWKELQAITGRELNLAEDAFKLQHLLDSNLLARRWAAVEASLHRWRSARQARTLGGAGRKQRRSSQNQVTTRGELARHALP